jgi:geranylgeranyl reductase
VYYRGSLSPDFYGWVFPHGDTMSVGTGSADKGFSLRGAVGRLRDAAGLQNATVFLSLASRRGKVAHWMNYPP